jgi:hypothetical protein
VNVTYQNTVKDFERLQSYVLKRTDFGRRSARNVFLYMTGIYALFCLVIGLFVHWMMALVSFAGGAAFFWFTKEMAIVSQVKREYAKEIYAQLFEPVTVSIETDGLRTDRAVGGGFYNWSGIDHVADTGEYLFVIMGDQGHIAVPAEAFDTPGDKTAFQEAMGERIELHQARA